MYIHNGKIYTIDKHFSLAEVVVVKNGIIEYAGTQKDCPFRPEQAQEVLDLKGRCMIPGLIEGHGHFLGMGEMEDRLNLLESQSYQELIEMAAERAKALPEGSWILGRGWHQSKWTQQPSKMVKGFMHHQALSDAVPHHPVFLQHASGHAAIANQKAMELAGLNPDTVVIGDGEIFRDEKGDPTGIFIEGAMDIIRGAIPERDEQGTLRAFNSAMHNCLRYGITSFVDAGSGEEDLDFFMQMAEKAETKIRLYVMVAGYEEGLAQKWYKREPIIGMGAGKLSIRSIKMYADGALGSRGAWLLDHYHDRHQHFGHPTVPMDSIAFHAEACMLNNYQLCTHAIGDRANREVLDVYEKALAGDRDRRFRIEHAQHLHPLDIPRFAQLGVIPAMQAIHMSSDRPWAIDRLGAKRIEEGAYMWQTLIQSGAHVVNGTDCPVEPLDPFACLYASVSRKTLSGQPEEGYEPGERMTREQAIRSYTIEAAYGSFEEKIKGSIEKGKLADFAILDTDILHCSDEELLNIEVEQTIFGGETVYQKN